MSGEAICHWEACPHGANCCHATAPEPREDVHIDPADVSVSFPDERDTAVAEVLAHHGPSGRINSREGWLGCICGDRLACEFDSSGYPLDVDAEDGLWASHRAEALAPLIAERVRAAAVEALRDAADDLEALVDAQHPDALNPDQWLRDRADRRAER